MKPLVLILTVIALAALLYLSQFSYSELPGGFVGDALAPVTKPTLTHAEIASGGLEILLGNDIVMKFVQVSSGSFTMGSPDTDPDARENEKPQSRVTLTRSFLIGMHEVTQEQYTQVMNLKPAHFVYEHSQKHPVEHVTWFDAVKFCNALSAATGLTPCYTDQHGSTKIETSDTISCAWKANGFRLPTEAEWEYACRAGTTTRYCCGDELDQDYSWNWKNSLVKYKPNSRGWGTNPVGSKKPNAWGIHDMHGSLWEWCWNWYSIPRATQSQEIDPIGPATGSVRVYRGGAWSSEPYSVRSAIRYGAPPYYRNGHMCFRVMRIIP